MYPHVSYLLKLVDFVCGNCPCVCFFLCIIIVAYVPTCQLLAERLVDFVCGNCPFAYFSVYIIIVAYVPTCQLLAERLVTLVSTGQLRPWGDS